jgi:hypothetical protein
LRLEAKVCAEQATRHDGTGSWETLPLVIRHDIPWSL